VDLEKAFDSIDRKVLWFKMRRNEESNNMFECIKRMYNGAKFIVKCGCNEVTYFVEQIRGVSVKCGCNEITYFVEQIRGVRQCYNLSS
jgi:hypothetical protein